MTALTADRAGAERLHALDAVRAGALLLGVAFHAALSFLPGPQLWVTRDAQSVELSVFFFTTHMFRMTLFFLIAGFFGRMLLERRGLGGFLRNRATRIALPMIVFWPIVFTGIITAFVFGYVAMHPEAAAPGAPPPPSPPLTAQNFPLTHLWFLYVLCIFYAAALALRGLIVAIDRKGALRGDVVDPVVRFVVKAQLTPLLAAPAGIALWLKPDWLMWFGVPTPDTGIYPNLAALLAFGAAFGFGWLLHRQTDLLRVWEKSWLLNLGSAIILTIACLALVGATPVVTPEAQAWKKAAFLIAYLLGAWSWTVGLIGMALRFLSERNPAIRYVSDASYWIYIAHLPVVMGLQVWVFQFDWPWAAKFALVLWLAFAALFLSYHVAVRYTFIGAILNGRKHKRRKDAPAPALAAAE
ncbi:MAG TPA: acyltransferase family protein [Caulobacterales bacterium]|nr:acyltransferase family protein [Caulobacterales bacterium]